VVLPGYRAQALMRHAVERIRHWWSGWKQKPRRPLIELDRNVGLVFNLIPLLFVIFGGEMALGLDGEGGLKRRFVGVLLVVIGVPFLYLDWVYIRRPVERDE
jgi:hypothetical protein